MLHHLLTSLLFFVRRLFKGSIYSRVAFIALGNIRYILGRTLQSCGSEKSRWRNKESGMSQEANREAKAKLDELAACYKVIYTRHLQSVSSLSSSGDLTCSMTSMPKKI